MNGTRICVAEGCDRPLKGRGWCNKHYQRAKANGTLTEQPRRMVRPGATLKERLEHIGWDVTASDCWEWRGSKSGKGYGQVAVGVYDGKVSRPRLAHRVSYEVFVGALDHRPLLHSCDNPPCINPSHLAPGSRAENLREMSERKRNPTGEYRPDVKLTDAQVEEIRRRYAAGGIKQRDLASEFGVSQQLVGLIAQGRRRRVASRPGQSGAPR